MPGGFRCDCKIGFNLDPLTNACEDINECQINNHECLEIQRCDNTIGSYRCIRTQSCGTGYTFNAETQNCEGKKKFNFPVDFTGKVFFRFSLLSVFQMTMNAYSVNITALIHMNVTIQRVSPVDLLFNLLTGNIKIKLLLSIKEKLSLWQNFTVNCL